MNISLGPLVYACPILHKCSFILNLLYNYTITDFKLPNKHLVCTPLLVAYIDNKQYNNNYDNGNSNDDSRDPASAYMVITIGLIIRTFIFSNKDFITISS